VTLTFSDSAKFAQAAQSLVQDQGLTVNHSFFSSQQLAQFQPGQSFSAGFLPLPSWILSLVFRFFPITDQTVIFTSLFFHLLSTLLVFLIAKKLHSIKAGLIATLFFIFNLPLIEYATNFASETTFIFLILLFVYLTLAPFKYKPLALLPLILIFFTRQQAFVFLASLLPLFFIWLATAKLSWFKKVIPIIFVVICFFALFRFTFKDVSSIFSPAKISGSLAMAPGLPAASYLRGQSTNQMSLGNLSIKIFHNFYNFSKSPARLVSPIIILLFVLSLFLKHKNKNLIYFHLLTLFSFIAFMLAASATLPNARYIHPVIPLVIIATSIALVRITNKLKIRYSKIFLVVVIIFIILPAIGHFTLDARFRKQQFNLDKPPAYKAISQTMAQHIPQDKLIITNLDAWAAWYQGLTTMWFPVSPDLLDGFQDKIDYIVITNYKEHDADFALNDWAEVVYQPESIQDGFLRGNYNLLTTFTIPSGQVYENQPYQGTILIKN